MGRQLKTQRIDGSIHNGEDLAARWPHFEDSLRNIFGIQADTAMSEAMQIGTGPDITMTGTLTASGAPTDDLHAASRSYLQAQGPGIGVVRARAYVGGLRITGISEYIPWSSISINVGDVWSVANRTRFTIPVAGDYMVGVTGVTHPYLSDSDFTIALYKNRTKAQTLFSRRYEAEDKDGFSGTAYANDCAVDDFLELQLFPHGGTGLDLWAVFWMFNL